MALCSLLARTTTTLCRARAPSGPVCVVPRMSPASSSRRYTSQGGYGRNWDNKEFDRQHTEQHFRKFRENLDLIKESRSERIIWSFVLPVTVVLSFGVYTVVSLGTGFVVGYAHGVKDTLETIVREVAKMKPGTLEAIVREVAKMKPDESTDDEIV